MMRGRPSSKETAASGVLIVGRNSFFARRFAAACTDLDIRHAAIDELERPEVCEGVGTIVNFAFDPRLYREPYAPALDVDRRIAEMIADLPLRYVLLSSRAVYGPAVRWNAREDAETVGDGVYGRNRVAVERAIRERLDPERLTILRIANTVAYELQPGRRETFMSILLGALRDRGEIRFEMSPRTRRDFITDTFFCSVLRRLVAQRANGVFNVGCGFPVATGDIADWVVEGYGSGRVVADPDTVRDEFFLNANRLHERIGMTQSPEALRDRCREIGRRLAGA
jgi:dTDP-4-dehydrorhamnose reductase